MLASVPAGVVRYTLGKLTGDLTGTPANELTILNQAGQMLCSAWPWKWLERQSAPLSLRAFQPWVDLPADLREILSVQAFEGLLNSIQPTGYRELLEMRTSQFQAAGLWTYYYAIENGYPELLNLLSATENWADAAWIPGSVTVGANLVPAPDGGTGGSSLTSTSSAFSIRQDVAMSAQTDARTYLFSVFVRHFSGTSTDISIKQQGPSATPETSSRAPQTVARLAWSGGAAVSFTLVSSQGLGVHPIGMESVGDSWYRCTVGLTYDRDVAKPNAELSVAIFPSSAGSGSIYAWGAQLERADVPVEDELMRPLRYVKNVAAPVAVSGAPVRRMAIWPTPSVDTFNAFSVYYRKAWAPVASEADVLVVPDWFEPLYLESCRVVARGAHEEDEAHLYARWEELHASRLFRDATAQDASSQVAYGPMRGTAARGGTMYRDWGRAKTYPVI